MTYQYTARANNDEISFMMELTELINDPSYEILKTKDKYCNVDYTHCYNGVSLGFIESKC